jgi:uncharacterized membrane protein
VIVKRRNKKMTLPMIFTIIIRKYQQTHTVPTYLL